MDSGLQFGAPAFLWGVWLSPLLIGVFVLHYFIRQKRLQKFADKRSLERISAEFSPLRYFLKSIFITLAVMALFFAAAQPKLGLKSVPVQRKGIDLIIALDVSKSMDTADVKPSRIQRARRSIETLLNKLAGDRIGLVVFAGEAMLIHPLTERASGFIITLDTLTTDIVPTPGTALGQAIKVSRASFDPKSVKHRVLVLITDGETHDEDALDQAKKAHDEGILIFTLGIGTPEGAPVPEYVSGDNVEYKKDNGKYVISSLNTNLLRDVAREGEGGFYHFTGTGDALDKLYERISAMGEEEMTDKFQELLNDIYQYPLALALLFIFIAQFIGNKRRLA